MGKNVQEFEDIEIEYNDWVFKVSGKYTKAEEAQLYCSDMSGYPGSNSSFEITSVLTQVDCDVLDDLNNEQVSEITDLVIQKIENN